MSVYLVLYSVLVHGVDLLVLSFVHSFPKTETKRAILESNYFLYQNKGYGENHVPTHVGPH